MRPLASRRFVSYALESQMSAPKEILDLASRFEEQPKSEP